MVADLREMQENQGFSERRIDKPEFAEVRNQMNKENVKQSTVDIFCEKKELEKSCLDNAISKV